MTREEAKSRINNKHSNGTIKKTIDEIYNDFEQERREQAIIRNERKSAFEIGTMKIAKEKAEQKYKALLHQYKTANKSLVKENKKLRKKIEE